MTNKEILITKLTIEREQSEQKLLSFISSLKRNLDVIENKIKDKTISATDSFQGNEWQIYREIVNLERIDDFIKQLKDVN